MVKPIFCFFAGIIAVILILETVFRVLPVSTATHSGYYIHPHILTYPPHHCFTASTGWDLKNAQSNCTNNEGFVADRDFIWNPQAIALIGDSFVEANMLPTSKRLASQLQRHIPNRPVYAMGGPGSNLLDYAERALFAADKYGIRFFIFVVERGDIKQSICGSGNIHGPCLDQNTQTLRIEKQPEPGFLKQRLRESALAQYLFSQIRLDPMKTVFRVMQEPKGTKQRSVESYDADTKLIVNTFMNKITAIEEAYFVFLIDADRPHLKLALPPTDPPDIGYLKESVRSLRGLAIDPTQMFSRHISETGRILEVGPYDQHWNEETVALIAKKIVTELEKNHYLRP